MRTRYLWSALGLVCLVFAGTFLSPGPDPGDWPELPAFSCRTCGGPASVDPQNVERWACQACGYVTADLWEHFDPTRRMTPDWHLAGRGEITEAMASTTPAEAWSRDRRRNW